MGTFTLTGSVAPLLAYPVTGGYGRYQVVLEPVNLSSAPLVVGAINPSGDIVTRAGGPLVAFTQPGLRYALRTLPELFPRIIFEAPADGTVIVAADLEESTSTGGSSVPLFTEGQLRTLIETGDASTLAAAKDYADTVVESGGFLEPYTFSVYGPITDAYEGEHSVFLEQDCSVESVHVSLGAPSTSGPFIVDVNKNGSTIYTDQNARPTLAQGVKDAVGGIPSQPLFAAGDFFTVDIDEAGFGAAHMTVVVRFRKIV